MDRDPGDQRRASLRACDADRERFVEAFGQHHAEGRLTIEELSERTERAYAARTFGDLDALATDLPPLSPSPPTTRPAGSPDRPEPTALPPRMRPPGPERAAAKANLLRSILWYAALSLFLVVVWRSAAATTFWPVWPILGFMLLVAWQSINLYSRVGRFDDDPPRPWRR
jgi:hypothetical protein